jgi:hypothetical protein
MPITLCVDLQLKWILKQSCNPSLELSNSTWNIPYTQGNQGDSQLSQPHFGQSVMMRLTLPKVRTWSPPGLPRFQSSTAKGKTTRLEVFFIPLERSWSVDVQNGLAWAIWTSAAQVMGKKKGWESNWKFDSRPLKVGNRPLLDVCRMSSNQLVVGLGCRSCNKIIVSLPSLIPGLLARPSYPL